MPGNMNDAKTRFEKSSSLEDWSGYVLLGGLMLETAILFAYPDGKSLLHISLEVVAYLLVFGGVFGEIMFAAEARKASDELSRAAELQIAELSTQAAEANARAAQAQLELAKFKAPRILGENEQARVASKIQPFAGSPFVMTVSFTPEATALLVQIEAALTSGGWVQKAWADPNKSDVVVGWTLPGKPLVGQNMMVGLYVQADESVKEAFTAPVVALVNALRAEGVEARSEVGRMPPAMDKTAIHIQIGEKPK